MAQNQPCGTAIGPLQLLGNLRRYPQGAHEILPKFSRDGKKSLEEHLNEFKTTCGVLAIATEDVTVRLFIQTLIDSVVDWFHHLPNGSITSWDTMKDAFETRFKVAEDANSLLMQLS